MADFDRPDKARKRLTPDAFRWYQRDPSRVLAGVRGLSVEQKALYLVLIELVYERRGALDGADMSTLARAADFETRVFKRVLRELIDLDRIKYDPKTHGIWDERAARELAANGLWRERQARRGKKGGRARASKARCGDSYPDSCADSYPDSYALNETRTPNEINGRGQANRKDKNTIQRDTPNDGARRPVSPPDGDGARGKHGMTIEEWKADQRRRLQLADEGKDEPSEAQRAAPGDETPADRKARRA